MAKPLVTLPVTPGTPFDWDAFNAGLAAILDVAASLPPGTTLGLGGTTQDAQQSIFFPQNDGSGADGTQNTLAKLTYEVTNVSGLGWDEWRMGYDPSIRLPNDTYRDKDGNQLGAIQYSAQGNRIITVQVLCECWDLSGSGAVKYIERIRDNLGLPGYIAQLRLIGVAINDIGKGNKADYKDDDGRDVSGCMVEIKFNAVGVALDEPMTTIEVVQNPTWNGHVPPEVAATYRGNVADPGTYDQAFVETLTASPPALSPNGSYAANDAPGTYQFFATKSSFGVVSLDFTVSSAPYAITRVAVVSFNVGGVIVNYDLWRSDNPGLGSYRYVVNHNG